MPRGAVVTDAAAERAARAVINAGVAWEGLRNAIAEIEASQLTPRAVALLLSDELELGMDDVQGVIRALTNFPNRYLSVAA